MSLPNLLSPSLAPSTKPKCAKAVFQIFDKNGTGSISISELGFLMQQLGLNASESEVEDVFHEIDHDGNGIIQLHELTSLLNKQIRDIDEEQELIDAFRVFDKSNSGLINSKQIVDVLISLGETISEAEIDSIISHVDSDKDGKINQAEFIILMTKL